MIPVVASPVLENDILPPGTNFKSNLPDLVASNSIFQIPPGDIFVLAFGYWSINALPSSSVVKLRITWSPVVTCICDSWLVIFLDLIFNSNSFSDVEPHAVSNITNMSINIKFILH